MRTLVGRVKNPINQSEGSIYLDGQNFFLDNKPISRDMLQTLHDNNSIKWLSGEVALVFLNNNTQSVFNTLTQQITLPLPEEFAKKTVETVTIADFQYAQQHPENPWSEFVLGIYCLKKKQEAVALKYLTNFYKRNPLEMQALKYIMSIQNNPIKDRHVLPNTLPESVAEFTISQKYLLDFLSLDLRQYPIKITKMKILNFVLTLVTITMLLTTFITAMFSK